MYLDAAYKSNKLLIIQLSSEINKDIFAYLCDSLIESIGNCETESKAIKVVINRLEKWDPYMSELALFTAYVRTDHVRTYAAIDPKRTV